MRVRALIFLTLVLLALESGAADKLDAASRVSLARHAVVPGKMARTLDQQFYQAFISVDDENTVNALRRHGASVSAVMDGFVIATVPAHALDAIASIRGISHISLARTLHLCNDTARLLAHVNPLQDVSLLAAPLTGKGVIVGMIDCGIDVHHINLCDEQGHTRVRAVYMPADQSGTPPVVNGNVLPGSCYETPEEIESLTTDYASSSHGTHTTGTAAGACRVNGWHGVATEADLVICGMPSSELTDANIAHAVLYTLDYADRVGKPCVINMSLGSNDGPNDGTSYLCRLFRQVTGPGHVCVVSAGNDGNAPICLHSYIHGVGDTVTTLLRNQWGGLQRQGFVSTWSDTKQPHRTRLVIINRSTGEMEYASPFLDLLPEDSVYCIQSESDAQFARYYDGEVQFANAIEPQCDQDGRLLDAGRFHAYWLLDATSVRSGHLLGMQYVADEPVALSGWTSKNCYFYTFGLDGMTGGSNAGSISDLATTDSVISVGAYCSRASYLNAADSIVNIAGCRPGDMAAFSSFGPDEHGVTRPDLCAPGMALISSASRFDSIASREQWPAPLVVDGAEYPYYANQGTSMSAPLVAGTVALMLQVNPSLGVDDVRRVLKRTAVVDDFVGHGNRQQWGSGKLDAAAAVLEVINNTFLPGDVNHDGEVGVADVMALINMILDGDEHCEATTIIRADVNHDCEIQVADINALIDLILNN